MSTSTATKAEPEHTLVGQSLGGRYVVEQLIGRGGMGLIYLARDLELGRLVVIKMLGPHGVGDPLALARFAREGELLQLFKHPNIVELFDRGEHDGQPYIVMEFVDGIPLRPFLARKERLHIREFVPIAAQILAAVGHVHQHNVMLRDVKPSNIMLCEVDGKTNCVKLVDFGLSCRLGQDTIDSGTHVVGTAGYLAPEQIRGDAADLRVDVYALGIVFFMMLGGDHPIEGDNDGAVLYNHVHGTPADLKKLLPRGHEVPQTVIDLIYRCMDKNPERRPADADEIAELLFEAVAPDMLGLPTATDQSRQMYLEYRALMQRAGKSWYGDEADVSVSSNEWTRPIPGRLMQRSEASLRRGRGTIPPPPPSRAASGPISKRTPKPPTQVHRALTPELLQQHHRTTLSEGVDPGDLTVRVPAPGSQLPPPVRGSRRPTTPYVDRAGVRDSRPDAPAINKPQRANPPRPAGMRRTKAKTSSLPNAIPVELALNTLFAKREDSPADPPMPVKVRENGRERGRSTPPPPPAPASTKPTKLNTGSPGRQPVGHGSASRARTSKPPRTAGAGFVQAPVHAKASVSDRFEDPSGAVPIVDRSASDFGASVIAEHPPKRNSSVFLVAVVAVALLGAVGYLALADNAQTTGVASAAGEDVRETRGTAEPLAIAEPPPSKTPEPAVSVGHLKLEGGPAGAVLFVDDSERGPLPFAGELAVGSHQLRVEAPEHEPWNQTFEVVEDGSHEFQVDLERVAARRTSPRAKPSSSLPGLDPGSNTGLPFEPAKAARRPPPPPSGTEVPKKADTPKPALEDVFLPVGKGKAGDS